MTSPTRLLRSTTVDPGSPAPAGGGERPSSSGRLAPRPRLTDEAHWLPNRLASPRVQQLREAAPAADAWYSRLPHCGVHVMRAPATTSPGRRTQRPGRQQGHAHNDALPSSWCSGPTILQDPGAGCTPRLAGRNLFRPPAYHHTLQIDGASDRMHRIASRYLDEDTHLDAAGSRTRRRPS